MVLLSVAILCCCVRCRSPCNHVVAYCGDLGFSSQYGAAMLSPLLGIGLFRPPVLGWLCDRVGGLQTLVWGSMAQMTALLGFALTQDATPVSVAAAFGFGQAGLVPAYVIVVRAYYLRRGGELAHADGAVRRHHGHGRRRLGRRTAVRLAGELPAGVRHRSGLSTC